MEVYQVFLWHTTNLYASHPPLKSSVGHAWHFSPIIHRINGHKCCLFRDLTSTEFVIIAFWSAEKLNVSLKVDQYCKNGWKTLELDYKGTLFANLFNLLLNVYYKKITIAISYLITYFSKIFQIYFFVLNAFLGLYQ